MRGKEREQELWTLFHCYIVLDSLRLLTEMDLMKQKKGKIPIQMYFIYNIAFIYDKSSYH